MRDKIIATITLTSIFSLFLYYKISSVDTDLTSYKSESINKEEITINVVEDVDFEENQEEISDETSDINLNTEECSYSLEETDKFSFSKAFKYYRSCLGQGEVFSWNSNQYKTLLSNEIQTTKNIEDSENAIVQNSNNADKHHLELQNQMFDRRVLLIPRGLIGFGLLVYLS